MMIPLLLKTVMIYELKALFNNSVHIILSVNQIKTIYDICIIQLVLTAGNFLVLENVYMGEVLPEEPAEL